MLSKIRRYITDEAATRIYKTMILPMMDHGDVLYAGANNRLLKKLQTLQNSCLRICMYKNYHISVNNLHLLCKVQKLDVRHEMHLKLFMFKQKLNLEIVNTRPVNTRAHGATLFVTIRPNSEKYKMNVFYKGALQYDQYECKGKKYCYVRRIERVS